MEDAVFTRGRRLPVAGGTVPVAGGPAPAADRPPRSLESLINTVRDGEVVVVGCRCRSRFCAYCGPKLGHELRGRLEEKVGLFPRVVVLTLTVDLAGTLTGRGFASPQASYEYVREHRLIPRLMSALGVGAWVSVLEFQGNGAPHWHILVDRFVDVYRMRELWWHTWGVGGMVDAQWRQFESPLHGIRYVTKYVTKVPRHGWPDWVLDWRGSSRIRVVGCSRNLGQVVRDDGNTERGAELGSESCTSTIRERVARCCAKCVALRKVADGDDVRWEYVGEIGLTWDQVAAGIAAGAAMPGSMLRRHCESDRVSLVLPSWVDQRALDRFGSVMARIDPSVLVALADSRGWDLDDVDRSVEGLDSRRVAAGRSSDDVSASCVVSSAVLSDEEVLCARAGFVAV